MNEPNNNSRKISTLERGQAKTQGLAMSGRTRRVGAGSLLKENSDQSLDTPNLIAGELDYAHPSPEKDSGEGLPPIDQALRLLCICYRVNGDAKQFERRKDRQYQYGRKTNLMNSAIKLIKENALPIKYGIGWDCYGDRVVYFQYGKHQISFHDPNDQVCTNKQFKGRWKGSTPKSDGFRSHFFKRWM